MRISAVQLETGKGFDRLSKSKSVAAKFIKNTLGKREEHGKGMVSSEDRHRIQVAKNGLERLERPGDKHALGRFTPDV
jgi:hypothetical protein